MGPSDVRLDGRWVLCRYGDRHFGPWGAAGLVLRDAAGRLLLTHRSALVHHGGTWSFPGGALEAGETPADAAIREVGEELGIPAQAVVTGATLIGLDHGDWRYTYVLATINPQWTQWTSGITLELNWETEAVAWVSPTEMVTYRLHPDLALDVPALHQALAAS